MIRDGRPKSARFSWLLVFAPIMLLALCACTLTGPGPTNAKPAKAGAPECATGVDFLGFSDALNKRTFEGTSVGGLSALTYSGRDGVYYSLVDNGPAPTSEARFYTLRLPTKGGTLGTPRILDVTTLKDDEGQPFTASNFDGEGLTLTRRGDLLASSETEPSIRRFSFEGELQRRLPVPRKYRVAPAGQATSNETFESLSLSPDNRSLFTAVEGPLAPDGQTADGKNRIRILRYKDRESGGFQPVEEFFYLTEPEQGVVEILALSKDELLVLERGFVAGEGNTIRVFRVSLDGAEEVSDEPSLVAPGLEPAEKELLVDLAACPESGAESPGTQQTNELLDNYESLALGPQLAGGRRALLLHSDDNFSTAQVTRVVGLGVEEEQLR